MHASKSFDAKAKTTSRMYYYYLPAFCLNSGFSSLLTAGVKERADEIF
jgi:tRNA U38,U39,U40 pseudouridine synthase TruA